MNTVVDIAVGYDPTTLNIIMHDVKSRAFKVIPHLIKKRETQN